VKYRKSLIKLAGLCYFLLFVSCSHDFFDVLSIKNAPPGISAPLVKSHETEHAIVIEWGRDEAADKYVLYRDTSPTGNFSYVVYQGTGLGVTDYNVVDRRFYYYRLAKIRETKELGKSAYVAGITDGTKKDKYENNDVLTKAYPLADTTIANIFYHEDGYGNRIEDRDWYKLLVPVNTKVHLVIDELSDGTALPIKTGEIVFNMEGDTGTDIFNGIDIWIGNYEYEERALYFQISVDSLEFGINKVMSYRIRKTETATIGDVD
jgi:hypothetical protein